MYTLCELLDLSHTLASEYLMQYKYHYEAIVGIKDMIINLGMSLDTNDYDEVDDHVWIHKSATVAPSAYIGAPSIICENVEIRHSAFIRSSALVGKGSVVGNSTELKNVILFDSVQVPHYNYVGDSILGYKAHMGAGSITSNVKSDKSLVSIKNSDGSVVETGLRKLGAILGDYAEVGCNSVLNPGTVVGRCSNIYPLSSVRGIVPSGSIYKSQSEIVLRK